MSVIDAQRIKMLVKDNSAMRTAGLDLAAAAAYTVGNYDGLHRLAIAAARFLQVVADEGGRDKRLGTALGQSKPLEPPPMPAGAEEAAGQVADAAVDAADAIKGDRG